MAVVPLVVPRPLLLAPADDGTGPLTMLLRPGVGAGRPLPLLAALPTLPAGSATRPFPFNPVAEPLAGACALLPLLPAPLLLLLLLLLLVLDVAAVSALLLSGLGKAVGMGAPTAAARRRARC
jgi:hypothetical protein